MGTRADFYVGRGTEAEWLGSIAWDGYPDGIDTSILEATDAEIYHRAVAAFLEARDDATFPNMGWPWPWDDSRTTDYAYAIEDGKVWASCFGHGWFDPLKPQDGDGDEERDETAVFPNMKDRQNVAWDKRSGVLFVTERREE